MSSLNPTTPYQNLFAASARAAAPPAGPLGGSDWNAGLNLIGGDQATLVSGGSSADQLRQGLLATFQQGVARDLAGANQQERLTRMLAGLTEGQLQSLNNLVAQGGTHAEQVFILKAYAVGEPWENLVSFANEMRGHSEAEIIRRATMRDDQDIIQQWQDSCGPAVLQTIAGEADPRFAWELNKIGDLAKIDPLGANALMAAQQKEWLERYGGVAVQRGQAGGQGIALGQMLNETIGPMVGVAYQTQEVAGLGSAMGAIEERLKAGFDVPLRVSWSAPGSGQDSGHFILAMNVRGTPGARELQIHDPWTGKTAWVSEQNIANNNFGPIFNSFARLSHYYHPQPTV